MCNNSISKSGVSASDLVSTVVTNPFVLSKSHSEMLFPTCFRIQAALGIFLSTDKPALP